MQLDYKFFSLKQPLDYTKFLEFVKSRKYVFQPVKSSCIESKVQLASAIERSMRRHIHGSRIRNTGILILMYVAYEDQIESAIRKCGVTEEDHSFFIIYEDQEDIREFEELFPYAVESVPDMPADHNDDMIFERMSYVESRIQ